MGVASSRKVLCESRESQKSVGHSDGDFQHLIASNRLVCDELCKKVQRGVRNKGQALRDCLPVVQKSPESVQQEDVRPILPVQED